MNDWWATFWAMFIIVLISMMVGCGPIVEINHEYGTPPQVPEELLPYYHEVEERLGHRVYVPAAFANIPAGTLGVCIYLSRSVIIDRMFFDMASDARREMVVFHELGHCEMGRGHRSALKDGSAVSLMHAYVTSNIDDKTWWERREAYMREVFR